MKSLLKTALLVSLSALVLTAATLVLAACTKKVGTTTMAVPDSVRHYYPVVQGEELKMDYYLKNTGAEPFVIDDIQPSCGCISVDPAGDVIPPGDSLQLRFTFATTKNVGYVRHTIRVFGNARPVGVVCLVFDVNVVPPADYTRDYEELYREQVDKESLGTEDLVNGQSSQKGYYVDINHDSRSHVQYPWRE